MKRWARFLKRARDEEQKDKLNLAIVAAKIIMQTLGVELLGNSQYLEHKLYIIRNAYWVRRSVLKTRGKYFKNTDSR